MGGLSREMNVVEAQRTDSCGHEEYTQEPGALKVSILAQRGRAPGETKEKANMMALWNSKEGRESANRESSKREDVPLLVTIDEPRGNSTDVRTGANEQEDNEQERLEIEKRRLSGGGVSVRPWPEKGVSKETSRRTMGARMISLRCSLGRGRIHKRKPRGQSASARGTLTFGVYGNPHILYSSRAHCNILLPDCASILQACVNPCSTQPKPSSFAE